MGFSVFLFGFGEEIAVDFDSSTFEKPAKEELSAALGYEHVNTALLIGKLGRKKSGDLYMNEWHAFIEVTDKNTGEVTQQVVLF